MKRCFFFFYHIVLHTARLNRLQPFPSEFLNLQRRSREKRIEKRISKSNIPKQPKQNPFFHVTWLLFLASERCIKTRRKRRKTSGKRKRRKKKSVAERKEAKIQRRRPTRGGDLWWDYRWRYFFITVSPLLFSLLLASFPTTTGWWR